jgi:hypothetical protein
MRGPTFKFTIRELVGLTAFVAVGFAALRYANEYWLVAIATAFWVALIAAAIVAVVERGGRQAFALGMVIAAVIYRVVLELPFAAYLATNYWQQDALLALAPTHSGIFSIIWWHLWTALIGYAGGRFALWVYSRRVAITGGVG